MHLSEGQLSTVNVKATRLKFNDEFYEIAIDRCVQCIDGNVIVCIASQNSIEMFAEGEARRLQQLGYHD